MAAFYCSGNADTGEFYQCRLSILCSDMFKFAQATFEPRQIKCFLAGAAWACLLKKGMRQ